MKPGDVTPEAVESAVVELSDGAPDADLHHALLELAAVATEADANPPFSEQTLVELHRAAERGPTDSAATDSAATASTATGSARRAPLRIAYAWTDARPDSRLLAGAGVVVEGQDGAPDVLEMVVRPDCRQRGIGTALTEALTTSALSPESGRVQRAWAHGEHDAAARLARRYGWTPVRELWRMRLTDLDEAPAPELPETVTLRGFRPGVDDQAWLAANAAAFADHPEQGRLTLEDLHARMAEDWFDPEGFLLAWEGEELLGFHWTKVQGAELGEVYVVGVVPGARGRGLGRSLTLAGIEHLHRAGLAAIMLYVDADNTAAVELYKKLGFTKWDADTMYAPTVEPAAEPA
ncbi:mycothiol synthase [Nesterenkonia sp. E16_7]|uniref:mycothiol synthase n=1 Tax=unclassified Nesterenkonia TaxID=2629769 RepID=UPI001A929766|nr:MULTISPECIES: mycothiol synthase [unclassified Nesterenkonia]MBO0594206.1 mycothiol synthase [Nesterenkonia sp. E16_10]MBO0597652.1 mycothiol synthase [Nesterenkonia sp. E16_7]